MIAAPSRFRRAGALLAGGLAVILVSCTTSENDAAGSTPSDAPTTVLPNEAETSIELVVPEGVTASGVVLAATLLAVGDIEAAVASGLVTPAEVDEARAAIQTDTLSRWVALAEAE